MLEKCDYEKHRENAGIYQHYDRVREEVPNKSCLNADTTSESGNIAKQAED